MVAYCAVWNVYARGMNFTGRERDVGRGPACLFLWNEMRGHSHQLPRQLPEEPGLPLAAACHLPAHAGVSQALLWDPWATKGRRLAGAALRAVHPENASSARMFLSENLFC